MFTSADRITPGLKIVSVFKCISLTCEKIIDFSMHKWDTSLVLLNSFTFLQDAQPPHHYLHTSQNLILFRNMFFKCGAEAVIFIEYFCVHTDSTQPFGKGLQTFTI